MSAAEWKKRCEDEWSLQGAPMPNSLDWKSIYEAKPLGKNLLKNPSPHGVHVFSKYGPAVRYVHFLPTEELVPDGFYSTVFTGSSVIVKPVKSQLPR
ncbi:F-box only protein 50 [Lates japonicus]|uniref:F-box only protein 50 n=1 Tax=Lates japonicus TaxID=270547 RepID=A0AAD3M4H2_LATJO|nr:F-box only protein 50 [Lates japonicus]